MSGSTAVASSNTEAELASMSKSKKKRMKQKKARQRKEEEERQRQQMEQSSIPKGSLNPLDTIRSDLTKLGYELSLVNNAMDEMWDQQLDYSDFEAVLAFIQDRIEAREEAPSDASKSMSVEVPEEPNTATCTDGSLTKPDLEEDVTESPTPTETSSSPSNFTFENKSLSMTQEAVASVDNAIPETISNAGANGGVTAPSTIHTTGDQIAVRSGADEAQEHAIAKKNTKKKRTKSAPFDLSAKLDIVADSDNLTDGIVALTEWVAKAASPPQILELCSSRSNALQTVIRRTILSGNMQFTGQLLDLIGTILRTVGAPSTQLVSSAKALGSLLKCANDACTVGTNDSSSSLTDSIANSVSKQAVTIVRSVVKQMIDYSKSSLSVGKSIEHEIQQMMVSVSPRSAGSRSSRTSKKSIVDLMTERDKSKSIAENYSAFVDMSMKELQGDKAATRTECLQKTMDEIDFMKDLLGDEYDNVLSSKAKMIELKSREEQINASIPERAELIDTISSFKADKNRITNKMEELRSEMLKLETEEKEVAKNIEDSESKLIALEGTHSEETKTVKDELAATSEKVKVEASVSLLSKQLCEFASTMDTVNNSKVSKNAGNSKDDTDMGNALNCLLMTTSRYFSSELNILLFLKTRAENIEVEISTLVREIREFEALGMSSTVGGMKANVKEMRKNLNADNDVIGALTREANDEKLRFVEQFQRCLVFAPLQSKELESLRSAITQLDEILVDIGISNDPSWSRFMANCKCENNESKVVSTANEQSQDKEKKSRCWNSSPRVKASLLDIQANEQNDNVDPIESRDFELKLSQPAE